MTTMIRQRKKRNQGITLVEVIISAALLAILFLALASSFGMNLKSVSTAKDMVQATLFLETTMQSLSAQSYDNLLAMNGNQFYSRTDATDSKYRIDLAVFTSQVDLLQVRAVLSDNKRNMELSRIMTNRSRR